MVYVQSKEGKMLMPTVRSGKVRRMLRDGQAIVVCKDPFTIRLTYESEEYVQLGKLPLDVPCESFEILRDFKKEKEERKYLSQCKKEYGITNSDHPRKKERKNKRYSKPKKANKVNKSNNSSKAIAKNVKPDTSGNKGTKADNGSQDQ